MSYKAVCLNHGNHAQALCKSDKEFLCTQCLIEKVHGDDHCELLEVSKMRSREQKMFLDLVHSFQVAKSKLNDRADIEETVEDEKERVLEEMDKRCEELKQKIHDMKEKAKQDAVKDFDKHVEKAKHEKSTLSKIVTSLQTQIDQLTAETDTDRQVAQRYQMLYDKQHRNRMALAKISDRNFACHGSFEMAANLREIETGKKHTFGKATLLSRTMPRNGHSQE